MRPLSSVSACSGGPEAVAIRVAYALHSRGYAKTSLHLLRVQLALQELAAMPSGKLAKTHMRVAASVRDG